VFGCNGFTLDNRGLMSGTTGVGASFSDDTKIAVANSGEIFGGEAGIKVVAVNGVEISNTGVIKSDQFGVWIADGIGFTAKVTNVNSIRGNVAAILVENGDRINLDNSGTLVGDVDCRSLGQKDKIVNSGDIVGDVLLGSGNDTYKGQAGRVGAVFGGPGKDVIIGGPESGTFTGGPGADRFVFKTAPDPFVNVKTITDFAPNKDRLELDHKIFTSLKHKGKLDDSDFHIGDKAKDKKDFILYDKSTGFVAYDADGSKNGAEPTVFAKLADHLKIKADDFLVI
jgi:Ca2+-binding RTX toxin-like protein